MKMQEKYALFLAGAAAGAVNGLFGAGGGMVLIPLLTLLSATEPEELFPSSVGIILPICLVSLTVRGLRTGIPWAEAWPYLPGSVLGGLLAAKFGKRIPVRWLHMGLGLLILWGGYRYLC